MSRKERTVFLRWATSGDQPAIKALIRTVGINPTGLAWRRFIVADEGGRVIGAGQVKVHSDGAREMASIAVEPGWQSKGIGRAIVCTIVSLQPDPLYLYCADHNESYYLQFGFRALTPDEMPRSLRRIHTFANTLLGALNAVSGQKRRLVVMGRGLVVA